MVYTNKFNKQGSIIIALTLFILGFSAPTLATMPSGAEAMLETAYASGQKTTFRTVLETALITWPDQRVLILEYAASLSGDYVLASERDEIEDHQTALEIKEQADRARGFAYVIDPKHWNMQVSLGAGSMTGDSDDKSIALGLSLNRSFNDIWDHKLKTDIGYARRAGITTQRRIQTDYELLYKAWEKSHITNFTRVESDKLSGYDLRIIETVGAGFDIITNDDYLLRLETGLGVRYTQFTLDDNENDLLLRMASFFEMQLSDDIGLHNNTAALVASGGATSLENKFTVSAKINAHLASSFGFEVKYDSDAPIDTSKIDTVTRVSLVYDF